MLADICWMLVGSLIGVLVTCYIWSKEKEDPIEYIPPQPIIRETKHIVPIYTEFVINEEELHGPADRYGYVEERLKRGLADEIWKFAMVVREENRMSFQYRFRAMVEVFDNGWMNPFLDEPSKEVDHES